MVPALHHAIQAHAHVVAQVVEAELVVGGVGDVGGIGRPPLLLLQHRHDHADAEAQEIVDLAHPAGVAAGQIVVDGDHVHAVARERVEVGGERRHQGLALAGLHLRDGAVVQHHAADQLDVEMALAQRPLGGLAHGGEGFDQQVVQRLALLQPGAELVGLGAQLLVGEGSELRLERVDPLDRLAHGLDEAVVRGTEQPLGEAAEHRYGASLSCAKPLALRTTVR